MSKPTAEAELLTILEAFEKDIGDDEKEAEWDDYYAGLPLRKKHELKDDPRNFVAAEGGCEMWPTATMKAVEAAYYRWRKKLLKPKQEETAYDMNPLSRAK